MKYKIKSENEWWDTHRPNIYDSLSDILRRRRSDFFANRNLFDNKNWQVDAEKVITDHTIKTQEINKLMKKIDLLFTTDFSNYGEGCWNTPAKDFEIRKHNARVLRMGNNYFAKINEYILMYCLQI